MKGSAPRRATVFREGNRIAIEPASHAVTDLLRPHLSFAAKKVLFGWARRVAQQEGRSPVVLTPVDLYTVDGKGRVVTHAGFKRRVTRALRAAGYDVGFEDLAPHPKPSVYTPDWSRLRDFELRHKQDEVLAKMVTYPMGRIDCPAGYGKSLLLALLAKACYRARILITTKRLPVLQSRIYPELCGMLPDVGLMTSKKTRNSGARVMCCSSGMLQHLDDTYDFLIADECHELACDGYAEGLSRFDRARYFGLSASHDMRYDGRDIQVEAYFGPVILSVTRQEAQEHAMVVPLVVEWRNVLSNVNPCDGLEGVEKARAGLWTHDLRNDLIAEDARAAGPDDQTLVVVSHLEHAVNLKARLPEFTLFYRPDDDNQAEIERYERRGLLPGGQPVLDDAAFSANVQALEQGRMLKAIATGVLNVGVDLRRLSVLVRGDAGGGGERDVQIPGRASRLHDGKAYATIRDYLDQFDPRGYGRKAAERSRNYEAQGFEQRFPRRSGRGTAHRLLFQE